MISFPSLSWSPLMPPEIEFSRLLSSGLLLLSLFVEESLGLLVMELLHEIDGARARVCLLLLEN